MRGQKRRAPPTSAYSYQCQGLGVHKNIISCSDHLLIIYISSDRHTLYDANVRKDKTWTGCCGGGHNMSGGARFIALARRRCHALPTIGRPGVYGARQSHAPGLACAACGSAPRARLRGRAELGPPQQAALHPAWRWWGRPPGVQPGALLPPAQGSAVSASPMCVALGGGVCSAELLHRLHAAKQGRTDWRAIACISMVRCVH